MPRKYTEQELEQNFLFELYPQGAYVQVSAIDPVTNTEIKIVGDRSVGTTQLKTLARNKLVYMLKKKGLISEGDDGRGRRPDGSIVV